MVWTVSCDCNNMSNGKIKSMKNFRQVKEFFEKGVASDTYEEVPVLTPYYVGTPKTSDSKWYATKWYKCCRCNCLWEINYPDPPAEGFVRKFSDGKYSPRDYSVRLAETPFTD